MFSLLVDFFVTKQDLEKIKTKIIPLALNIYRFLCKYYMISSERIKKSYSIATGSYRHMSSRITPYNDNKFIITYWLTNKKYCILVKPEIFHMEDLVKFETGDEESGGINDITDDLLPFIRGCHSVKPITPNELDYTTINMTSILTDDHPVSINVNENISKDDVVTRLLMVAI